MNQLSNSWFVWATAALGLSFSTRFPEEYKSNKTCLAIAYTGAALDISFLRREERENGWVWVRPRLMHQFDRTGKPTSFAQDACFGWTRTKTGWEKEGELEQTVPISQIEQFLKNEVNTDWDTILVYGLEEAQIDQLQERFPDKIIEVAEEDALAFGAYSFLELHLQELPTWEDELPQLEVELKGNRERKLIPLFKGSQCIRPGDRYIRKCDDIALCIPSGKRSFRIPMQDEYQNNYSALCSGTSLPLEQATEVVLTLDFTYGRSGIQGFISPKKLAKFERIAFNLEFQKPLEEYPKKEKKLVFFSPDEEKRIQNVLQSCTKTVGKGKRAKTFLDSEKLERQISALRLPSRVPTKIIEEAVVNLLSNPMERTKKKKQKQKVRHTLFIRNLDNLKFVIEEDSFETFRIIAVCTEVGVYPDEYYDWISQHRTDFPVEKRFFLLGKWTISSSRLDDFLSIRPSRAHELRHWLKGLYQSLIHPQTGIKLEQGQQICRLLISILEEYQSETKLQKEILYRCFLIAIALCHYRKAGELFLQPKDEDYQELLQLVQELRNNLPKEIREYGEADIPHKDGEAVAQAEDALTGNYGTIIGEGK